MNDSLSESQISLLSLVPKLNTRHLGVLDLLVKNPVLSQISREFIIHRNRRFDPGLNLFTIISDNYKKENFHSDILRILLDPNENHKEGDKFLNHFLDYLNIHRPEINVKTSNYTSVTVEREKDNIDICIKDQNSRHAVIIENKINNAPDMQQQIPRYFRKLQKLGYQVDAVVYLVLEGNKQADTRSWNSADIKEIHPLVLPVAAYNETGKDLYNGWLKKCENSAENIDALFLLRHYNKLIYTIGGTNMNKPLMESFMHNMMLDDNYETAYALKDMIENLIFYRRDKIIDHFKFSSLPFTKVHEWNHYAVFNHYNLGASSLAIDVIVTKDRYQLQFFDRNFSPSPDTPIVNPAEQILREIGIVEDFTSAGLRMEKQFSFPKQENELYRYIEMILEKIKNYDQALNNKVQQEILSS